VDPGVVDWADEAFAVLTALPGARRVGLALVEGGGRRLQFTASDRDGAVQPWCEVDGYDDVPLNTAVRSGEPVIGMLDDLAETFPAFVGHQRGTAYVALAAVPLVARDDVLGGAIVYFDQPMQVDDPELVRLGADLGLRLWKARGAGLRRPVLADTDLPPHARAAVHEAPGGTASVGAARSFLRSVLRDWGAPETVVESAALCLSELVTNAVIHTHGGYLVRVVSYDGRVRVSVRDAGSSGAARVTPATDPLQVHGRGLQVVEAMATSWGHEVDDGGLSVWFEIEGD
jgi:anti-sigma regulatory factor (Ser/Thr protein kinase)